jgi:hypothetical protein
MSRMRVEVEKWVVSVIKEIEDGIKEVGELEGGKGEFGGGGFYKS